MEWQKANKYSCVKDVVLHNTGYSDIDQFLNGSLKDYKIKNLTAAAQMIKDAIAKKMIITIVGDYDADGVTSVSGLKLLLESMNAIVNVRIPRRLSEGYGLSTKIIDEIDSGLVITVDNGIVAFDAIKKAKEKGLLVIVTDHHLMSEDGTLPDADIIIDPHIEGTSDFKDYCGAGIVYKLAQEMTNDIKLLKKISCFAAIGTICDVMPLIEDNRRIVKEGLKNMVTYNARTSGLYSLLKANDMDKKITEENIGFKIGPEINAAGRLYDDGAMIPYEIISYDGPYDEDLANKLIEINEKRKKLVVDSLKKIELNIQTNCLFADYPLVIYEPNLEEGIVGILAGRLAEQYNVPTFVFTDSSVPGIYKGSARSACGVHLKNLLDASKEHLYKYGGHEAAAGVSVKEDDYYDMIEAFTENIPEPKEETNTDTLYYDLEINVKDVDTILTELDKYAPFGEGNPKIRFKINGFQLSPRYSAFYKVMGDKEQHLKLFGVNVEAVGFDMADKYFEMKEPRLINLIGTIGTNHFMGRTSVQLTMDDFISCGKVKKTTLAQMIEERAKNRYL